MRAWTMMSRTARKDSDTRRADAKDVNTSSRTRVAAVKKRATWDLSDTWRYRQRDEVRFLSSPERRYLKDALASLEKSSQNLTGKFPVKKVGRASSPPGRIPQPMLELLARGLVEIIADDKRGRGKLTARGVTVVREWLATKPPDFVVMFPKLYRAIGEEGANAATRVSR